MGQERDYHGKRSSRHSQFVEVFIANRADAKFNLVNHLHELGQGRTSHAMGSADFHDGADDGIDFRDALADCQIAPYARMALRIGTIKCNDRCEVGARRIDTGVWHKRSGFEPVEPPWGY